MRSLGYMTVGFRSLDSEVQARVMSKVSDEIKRVDDDFYCVEVEGDKYFACRNEEGTLTFMLPSEY